MANASQGAKVVTTLFVGMLLAAFLMPTVVDTIAAPSNTTITQDVNENVTLSGDLSANLTSTTTGSPDTATYELSLNGAKTTATIDNQTSQELTVDGTDVTVKPTNVTSDQATTNYVYPTEAGWGSGAGAIWTIIPLMIVLTLFLFVTGLAIERVG